MDDYKKRLADLEFNLKRKIYVIRTSYKYRIKEIYKAYNIINYLECLNMVLGVSPRLYMYDMESMSLLKYNEKDRKYYKVSWEEFSGLAEDETDETEEETNEAVNTSIIDNSFENAPMPMIDEKPPF